MKIKLNHKCKNHCRCNDWDKYKVLECEMCNSTELNVDYYLFLPCNRILYIVTCNTCHFTRQYIKPIYMFQFLQNHECYHENCDCGEDHCNHHNCYDVTFKHFCEFENFAEYPNCDNFAALHCPRTMPY